MKQLLCLAAAFSVLLGCAPITPTPSAPVSSTPVVTPSPVAAVSPVPPSSTIVALLVSVQMIEQCGSEGGCAFYSDLTDPDGRTSTEKIDVGSNLVSPIPRRLAIGVYTLTLRSSLVSDVSMNGAPPLQTPDAVCKTTFEVAPGQTVIMAHGIFRADSCDVTITAS